MKTLYQLVHYDVFRLFWLFAIIWLVGNYSMGVVEKMVWGERFTNWLDLIWVGVLAIAFGWIAFNMGQEIVVNFINGHK